MNKEPKRIPYESRAYSQLSVAKHYWWIKINWVEYVLDYDNCKKEVRDWEEFFYPDLVEVWTKKKAKTKEEKIYQKALDFYNENLKCTKISHP